MSEIIVVGLILVISTFGLIALIVGIKILNNEILFTDDELTEKPKK